MFPLDLPVFPGPKELLSAHQRRARKKRTPRGVLFTAVRFPLTERSSRSHIQFPHSMEILLNIPSTSSMLVAFFSSPARSRTMWPWFIMRRRSPYSTA